MPYIIEKEYCEKCGSNQPHKFSFKVTCTTCGNAVDTSEEEDDE